MRLETYIKERLERKKILLMTHIVIGYPDFETSWAIVSEMVKAGVDLMELQIPFSEPIADGPVILKANQIALENGTSVTGCFNFARQVADMFPIPFLFMTYTNIPFCMGFDTFAKKTAEIGLKGAIIPDLPPEEGRVYLSTMNHSNLHPIFIFSPETNEQRMKKIDEVASGFIYCVARKGVTGNPTEFTQDLTQYLLRCRKTTNLPIAVGFGVKTSYDIQFLIKKAEIAVIGSELIRIIDRSGPKAAGEFIRKLSS